jgi:hypothetical protein
MTAQAGAALMLFAGINYCFGMSGLLAALFAAAGLVVVLCACLSVFQRRASERAAAWYDREVAPYQDDPNVLER